MVGAIADAIVEAKGGLLEVAYQEDQTEKDITMQDVMINVEQQAAEYERKKRQRYEERRQAMQNRRNSYNNGERRVFRKDARQNAEAKTEAPKAEASAVKEEAK